MTIQFHPKDDRVMAMLVARIGGNSLHAIGQEFGVTRERVRQLLKQAGWEDRYTGDELGVVTWKEGGTGTQRYRRRVANQRRVRARQKAARREQVERLQALARTLGRTPTLSEFGATYGLSRSSSASLTAKWSSYRGKRTTPYPERTKRLYRAAGMVPYGPGDAPTDAEWPATWKARRREIVAVAKRLGGRPSLAAIGRELSFASPTRPGNSVVLAFRSRATPGWYPIASARVYRACGLDGRQGRP